MFKSLLLKGRTLCLLLCCMVSSLVVTAQTKHTGKVIGSDDKLPVVGASVRIKGTNTGTVTDVNGDFSLSLSPGQVIEISYIGYVTQNYTVRGTDFITISLNPSASTLNEVVVTGYTSQVKKDITGSVATVDVSDAKKVPVTSSEQLLQGQASGVNVINEGAPGAPSTVYVRGITNFGNTSPLYVIDGVQTNNMSQVNPTDIESIAVLKDAGAAAIYGVSGGNGVIVITTKKGKAGKTTISYDGYFGDQQPLQGNVWNLMTPTQQSVLAYQAHDPSASVLYPGGPGILPTYGYHGNAAYSTFGSAGVTDNSAITGGYFFDPNNPGNDFLVQQFDQSGTDWFHDIFKSAPEQSHTITASGGNGKNTFLVSMQYLNQEGTLINTWERRYQLRVNTNFSALDDHFRFGESAYAFYRENNGGSPYNQQQEGGSISYTYREMPLIPAYDIAGNFGGGFDGPSGEPLGNGSNPLAMQMQTANNNSLMWNMQGTMFAEADIAKHFTVRTAFSDESFNNFYYYSGAIPYQNYESHTNPNSDQETSLYSYSWNWTNTIKYSQTFGKSNIQVLGGYELKATGGQQLGAYATNFVTLDPAFLTVGANTNPSSINITDSNGNGTTIFQPTGTESYFARLDYSFEDKYLLGATIRRDGFSNFFPGHQWGTFPSVSLGWRISQEDFMKGISWINDLKLRGSYGATGSDANIPGNNAVNTYNYGFGSTFYGINGGLNNVTTGFAQAGIGNAKTTWETDKITNIGFDATLFNHVDMTVEYYKKAISGLLFPLTLPAAAGGASAPYINVGDVQNTGVDISATYHGSLSQDFRFSVGANITSYNNKITGLNTGQQYFDVFSGSRIGSFVREAIGEPIGEFFGYQTEGIYQNPSQVSSLPGYSGAAPGSYIYKDVNGDGKIDANDRTYIGNPNPNFSYGVNINLNYKQFDLSMVLYGEQGNKDFNYIKYWTDTYNSFPGGKNIELLTNSALPSNATNATTIASSTITNPSATLQWYGASTPPSSFYVENGSFLKCRVAQLGYTFAPNLIKGVDRLHLYFQVTNLFTITKYTGLDPELVPSINNASGGQQSVSSGVDWGAYPNNQRTFLVGANISFN